MALIDVAAVTFQIGPLDFVLDTFGYDDEVERMSHHDDRAHQRTLLGPCADVLDEPFVDFQNVDRKSLQSTE